MASTKWGVYATPTCVSFWKAHWVVTEPLTEEEAIEEATLWREASNATLTYAAKRLPKPPPKPDRLRGGYGADDDPRIENEK
jgi:hypothetical protein